MTLPDDPGNLNEDRAEWAGNAVAAFMQTTGTEPGNALPDLLCDLMHWADRNGECFNSCLQHARYHYAEETSRVDRLEAHSQALRSLITHEENLKYASFLDSLDDLIENLQDKYSSAPAQAGDDS